MIPMKKIIFTVISLILVSIVPHSLGQLSLEDPASQISLEIAIDDEGKVHVIHEIARSSSTQSLDLIKGENSNLTVRNPDGLDVEHSINQSQENFSVLIFPTNSNVFVEYDLDNVIKTENGVSKWDFSYNISSVLIQFPETNDLVFLNEEPQELGNSRMINCHGCNITLEYILNEPIVSQIINWEDEKFEILVRTLSEMSSFNFDQPSKSISFNLLEDNQFVTLLIPPELLGSPFQVYVDGDPIQHHPLFIDGVDRGLSIRPSTSGTVQIIGTSVIPEFPLFLPLIFGMVMVLGVQMKNKLILH